MPPDTENGFWPNMENSGEQCFIEHTMEYLLLNLCSTAILCTATSIYKHIAHTEWTVKLDKRNGNEVKDAKIKTLPKIFS